MSELLEQLAKVEETIRLPWYGKLMTHPVKYISVKFFNLLAYPIWHKGITLSANTFFGKKMDIVLPSATDIYLTGGKSHNSEIRLAKFMIRHLKPGDVYIDIGAHYGYFSLLAATLVGKSGHVSAFEASKNNFEVLKKNTSNESNISIYNKAVADREGIVSFFEFPVMYSEYNTLKVDQFEKEKWIKKFKPDQREIKTISFDTFVKEQSQSPKMVKIDVEGAELQVVDGMSTFLIQDQQNAFIIMEYLLADRQNEAHKAAKTKLEELGYKCCMINDLGNLYTSGDPETNMYFSGLDSDNLVFVKKLP